MTKILTTAEALSEGLREEMEKNEAVFIMGEDIGVFGGRAKVTKGLLEKFGNRRVIETPINEELFVGIAIGAAQVGLRPVVEFSHEGLLTIAATDIVRAGIWKWICKNRFDLPITMRVAVSESAGPELSTSIISMFLNVLGLKIVAPSTPYQAKGVLKSAIRGNGPVIILEHVKIYPQKGEIPDSEYLFPFGKGELRRTGNDVSIITYYRFNDLAETAAKQLVAEGIDVEILDLVSIAPLDKEKILKTADKTKKVLVLGDEPMNYSGLYNKIYMLIKEEIPQVRIKFLGTKNLPVPLGHFSQAVFPTKEDVIANIKEMIFK